MSYSYSKGGPPRRMEAAVREAGMSYDFDSWAEIARTDPERFEALREELVRRQIAQAPAASRRRLAGLQWRIDRIREHSGTPLAACIAISGLMWESMLGEGGLVDRIRGLGQAPDETDRTNTKVVPLRPPHSRRPG
ncbi:MAG: DUF3135 domain-containing protein [Gammaproteobacteria bacterium]|nr:MAG: DUF3135 domain-containing protein [Gammaproteobacteria bacterium]